MASLASCIKPSTCNGDKNSELNCIRPSTCISDKKSELRGVVDLFDEFLFRPKPIFAAHSS